MMLRNKTRFAAPLAVAAVLLSGCGLKRHKYDNPITKDTQQPDKVLFDKAINDIEHSRFEIARLLLQNYGGFLPRRGHEYAEQIKEASAQMERLRQDLVGSLGLSNDEKAAYDFVA